MAAHTAGAYYLVASASPALSHRGYFGGYYLTGSNGGVFTFPTSGGPPFLGSTGSIVLDAPIIGIAG
jgi:hypothetical protein